LSESEAKKQRAFFAIVPDETVRKHLLSLQKQLKKKFPSEKVRWITPENLHLTLKFLGPIDHSQLSCVINRAKDLQIPSIKLYFDQLGMFRKSGICWLGCQNDAQALIELQHVLAKKTSECGLIPEKRKFSPHITLARKFNASLVGVKTQTIEWPVTNIQLMVSKQTNEGVYYQTLETFSSNDVL